MKTQSDVLIYEDPDGNRILVVAVGEILADGTRAYQSISGHPAVAPATFRLKQEQLEPYEEKEGSDYATVV